MENYFILLELPFDPAENNPEKIKAAIAQKQSLWSKEKSHPKKGPKASEYLEQLSHIKEVMEDAQKREKEAAQAKSIRIEKEKELIDKLKMYKLKNNMISDKDIGRLLNVFGPYGFSKEDLKNEFAKLGDQEDQTIDPSDVLDSAHQLNLERYMDQLKMQDKTIYDFLAVNKQTSSAIMRKTAEEIKKEILNKANKTSKDNLKQELAGLCAVIFSDEKSKKKYDNYVALTKYGKVNGAIKELALGNEKKIETKMKEGLIDIAIRGYGISVGEASIYISNYCSYMGYTLSENSVICGLCGEESPSSSINCSKCHELLEITCPSCGVKNSNAAKACARCGFDLTTMEEALKLLKQAKSKYDQKDLIEAEGLLKKAKGFWPSHQEINNFEKKIETEKKHASELITGIMEEINNKRLYGARTKINQAKALGFKIDEAISHDVDKKLAHVEERLQFLRGVSGNEAFTVAMALSKLISDSDELTQSLKGYTPEESPGIAYELILSSAIVRWEKSPSIGELTYHLLRKENNYPNDPADGKLVYKGKELSFTDQNIETNKAFCYSLFVERAGVFSRATRLREPIVNVQNLGNIKAVGGDGIITLSWHRPRTVSEIKVSLYCGNERPSDDALYKRVPSARLDGLLIENVLNGSIYWIAISAGHAINGKIYFSQNTYMSLMPQKPAKPLEGFKVRLVDDIFKASWKASSWDVVLFYSENKPTYAVGAIYDINDLLKTYKQININLKSKEEAEFKLRFIGECYIIPGVINGSNVIMNSPAYISSVLSVKDLSFDLAPAGTEIYVNFTWPRGIDRAMIVYRLDDYPSGVDDSLANKIESSKLQYEANEGIVVNNLVEGTYFAEVYTYFEKGTHRVYSEGVRLELNNEPQKEVFYSFKYKKTGLFSKKYKLEMTIETEASCVFPAFSIISKYKSVPLKRGDGEPIVAVEGQTQINQTKTLEFDVNNLKPETRLKAFFLNDKDYKAFKMVCKAGNKI